MEYLAAGYQKGEGLAFLGKTHVPGGFCMFLCGVYREDKIDRELSEYVWRRLKHWAMGHRVTVNSPEELEQLLTELQEEVENYGQIQKRRGRMGEIGWTYLTLLLQVEELALAAIRGQGQMLVCQNSWGKKVWSPLFNGEKNGMQLVRLQPRVGILLSERKIAVSSEWQQVLDPAEIRNEKQLQKRVKELGEYAPKKIGNLAYMIYKGE